MKIVGNDGDKKTVNPLAVLFGVVLLLVIVSAIVVDKPDKPATTSTYTHSYNGGSTGKLVEA